MESKEEKEEKRVNVNRHFFFDSGCYNKEWVSLTNEPQKLNSLICCLCNEITNNAMELQCGEHDNGERVYLIGEECLQRYLKQSSGKCPIEQHYHCEFSKNKVVRQLVSDLMVICPRQFDLNKHFRPTKPGESEEREKQSNSKYGCNFKGKMKDIQDHLDKSCNLTYIEQVISSEIQSHLNVVNQQLKQLQDTNQHLLSQLQTETTLQIVLSLFLQ
ncbi:hypothetical protein RFI_26614 [Reticulomyxa filosa]|uniref:TRAF-type domain-containing protein n=1 Tax=Reticulomyxa filosa TaxID=46433 RepID=X6M9S6_RETFI|nr:hypothetical protein RFI_26614 [Reticulomyxa filosa]|eukprot:ETO10763.1 hypothetical protein RFI_26614 [Reticulomyxa filosa]